MKRIYPFICIFFFILLFTFAFLHTWEYDEAWTWLSVKNESFGDLVLYKHFNIANNHILNSLWFKLMQTIGCRHVIFYRMASLFSYILYCYFLWKAITWKTPLADIKSDWWLILFFLPPIMIYFTLGRGYAMATTFFLGSLYYMKAWLDEKRTSDYWKFFCCGVISSLSIVSFLFPFLAMLIYLFFRSGGKVFSVRNIISAVLVLPLLGYIYYVGKIILLNDKIINGTDHLFVNGMYSTFFGFLGIYDFIFPSPELLEHLNLVLISKILVPLSFVPVVWIMLRKRKARAFPELTLLVLITLMLLSAHLVLKAKYPSDRSVIYFLYLLYIPIVLYIIREKNKLFKLHYLVVIFFSLVNFAGYAYALARPDFYGVMAAKPVRTYTILSDLQNYPDEVYNELYFDGRLQVHYIATSFESDWGKTDRVIASALKEGSADFLLVQRSTWLRDQSMFAGRPAQKLLTSSYKEVYLIPIKRAAQ
ncbi:MAG: hypothetical protein BGO55_18995 [Sphingobacteriales bacterium 50-39]|nr:hypothetical protein [Sphingobacteriales bacterium]OJW59197.1 MAG: hypothetical protein BGO55_18995 [Sphingobacteriales bacterium 50-39]